MSPESSYRDINANVSEAQRRMSRELGSDIFLLREVGYLQNYMERFFRRERWTPFVEERTVRLSRSFGFVSGERYLESASELLDNPDFDLDEYSSLTLDAFRQFGKRAGDSFVRYFHIVFNNGLSGQEYFTQVETAIAAGGKLFGAKYAKRLCDVLDAGGDPTEFRTTSSHVRRNTDVKLSDKFMSLYPYILGNGVRSVGEYADATIESSRLLGSESTRAGLTAMINLDINKGYSPTDFIEDGVHVLEQVGPQSIKWYMHGLSRLTEYAALEKINPLAYQNAFLDILKSEEKTAAVLYVLTIVDIEKSRDDLLRFKQRVSKKVFNKVAWFGPKIRGLLYNGSMDQLYANLARIYEDEGEDVAIEVLLYTSGAIGAMFSRNRPSELIYPPSLIEQDEYDMYEETDRWH